MTNGIATTSEITKPAPTAVRLNTTADKALKAAAEFWFVTAVIGQWIFAYYIAFFYGGSALRGDFAAWNQVLSHGFVPGDTMGNFAVGAHLLLAVVIIVGGPLQLVPKVRTSAPTFHRWNGRLYMLTAFILSLGGIYMVLTRGTVGDISQHVAVIINGILIMLFAITALRHAMARDIRTHRRWALRLFLAVSGVWFFRVGIMLWLLIHQRPVGFDPQTFTGPFLTFLAFAQYLLPLAILQMYFYARDKGTVTGRLIMAGSLIVVTVAMGAGIFAATMGMWMPRL